MQKMLKQMCCDKAEVYRDAITQQGRCNMPTQTTLKLRISLHKNSRKIGKKQHSNKKISDAESLHLRKKLFMPNMQEDSKKHLNNNKKLFQSTNNDNMNMSENSFPQNVASNNAEDQL